MHTLERDPPSSQGGRQQRSDLTRTVLPLLYLRKKKKKIPEKKRKKKKKKIPKKKKKFQEKKKKFPGKKKKISEWSHSTSSLLSRDISKGLTIQAGRHLRHLRGLGFITVANINHCNIQLICHLHLPRPRKCRFPPWKPRPELFPEAWHFRLVIKPRRKFLKAKKVFAREGVNVEDYQTGLITTTEPLLVSQAYKYIHTSYLAPTARQASSS